jgi:hypothetical protein
MFIKSFLMVVVFLMTLPAIFVGRVVLTQVQPMDLDAVVVVLGVLSFVFVAIGSDITKQYQRDSDLFAAHGFYDMLRDMQYGNVPQVRLMSAGMVFCGVGFLVIAQIVPTFPLFMLAGFGCWMFAFVLYGEYVHSVVTIEREYQQRLKKYKLHWGTQLLEI